VKDKTENRVWDQDQVVEEQDQEHILRSWEQYHVHKTSSLTELHIDTSVIILVMPTVLRIVSGFRSCVWSDDCVGIISVHALRLIIIIIIIPVSRRETTRLGCDCELAPDYILQPVAVENLGFFDLSTSSFLSDLGSKIRISSGEDKETSFLLQRISVLIQCFNSVLLHDSFIKDGPDQ